ncbi:Alpha/Beta hydrolase protein [Lasiosphaeria ovina]|uniref:Alpha/Beta hydrolase protein n=1 Tax=Lasiosphaeria ovina TaxID=92902 RepID=A0AAE0KBJ4_9PEZI|nr:Alpha/Beta hydrolase protein [Lasiosphaeria ovina]
MEVQWPDRHRHTDTIKTGDGVRLSYNQTGPRNGQQLLFVTGWRQAAVEWRKQVKYFSSVGFRVTTFDMRGHGESDEPDFGYRYPDARKRVAKLVLVDQTADIIRDPSWTDAQAALISAIFTPNAVYDLYADILAGQLEPLVRGMFTSSVSESDFEWFLSQNKKMSDVNAAALLLDHSFKDWRDVLPRISVPTLVLAGEVSVFPHAGIEWIATQVPGARNYTFTAAEKGSHFVFWENPERFNSVLLDFLKARR